METGTCYVYNNATTIYAYPNLVCSDGSPLPSFNETVREVYYINRGQAILASSNNVAGNAGYGSTYIAHIYNGETFLDHNTFVLPATLVVLCFLAIIYKWFIRLRG